MHKGTKPLKILLTTSLSSAFKLVEIIIPLEIKHALTSISDKEIMNVMILVRVPSL